MDHSDSRHDMITEYLLTEIKDPKCLLYY